MLFELPYEGGERGHEMSTQLNLLLIISAGEQNEKQALADKMTSDTTAYLIAHWPLEHTPKTAFPIKKHEREVGKLQSCFRLQM